MGFIAFKLLAKYNEYNKLFINALFFHVGLLTQLEFDALQAKDPSSISMTRDQVFNICRLVNSIIYAPESECNGIIDEQLIGNLDRILFRAKNDNDDWQRKQTINDLSILLRYSETDNNIELKEFYRLSGITND